MVATIRALGGAADAARYFTSAQVTNYYSEGGDSPGQWYGQGAKILGLRGAPTFDSLVAVLSGCDPSSKRPLMRKRRPRNDTGSPEDAGPSSDEPSDKKLQRRERCPGVDLNLTLWQDLTIVRAVGGETIRASVDESFDAAAKLLFDGIEDHLPLCRRGLGGIIQCKSKLVVAMFDHETSRATEHEPHRHRHCLIANLAQGEDGRWSAVNTRMLFEWTRTLGPIFRCLLSAELNKRLNLELRPVLDEDKQPRGWVELHGIPESLRRLWSTRHDEIEQFLAGDKSLSGLASANAKAAAQVKTRQAKRQTPPRDQLYAKWEEEGRKHGFGPKQVAAMLERSVRKQPDQYRDAFRKSIVDLTASSASFTRQQLIQRVCERLCHTGLDGIEIIHRINRDLTCSPEIVRLAEKDGDTHFTSRTMRNLEKKLLADAQHLHESTGVRVSDRSIQRLIDGKPHATAEQKEAIRLLLSDKARIRTLSGVAGSGKTFVLDAVRSGLEREGYEVLGGALSGIAKEELATQANIKSRTIASYLYHLDKPLLKRITDRLRHDVRQLIRAARGKRTYLPTKLKFGRKTVLILDEAGMLDTKTLARLLHHARKSGATVILVGDTHQLSPIGAGGPFGRITKITNGPTLSQNRRQRHDVDKKAVTLIRDGEGQAALKLYAEHDRLTLGKNKVDTMNRLVEDWSKAGGAVSPNEHLILTSTRREAHALNLRCQQIRQQLSQVDTSSGVKVADGYLYRGDRILFHNSYRAAGIENGHQGTVLKINTLTKRITVRLDKWVQIGRNGKRMQPIVTVPLRSLKPEAVGLAYAATTHKMQGRTVANAYLLLGGAMTEQEMTYVQATRAREITRLYVDESHAGPELAGIAKAISQSKRKLMAEDIVKPIERKRSPKLEIER
ncbi:MAG: relaxase domain-containing protein [Pirellulales bacterium]|nr:relaxase domain-containing protein [Pirellulales bacterium]